MDKLDKLSLSVAIIHGEIQKLVGAKANERLDAISNLYEKHITELQADNARLETIISVLTIADETGYVDGEGFVAEYNEITDEAAKILAKRDLLMKKQGVIEFSQAFGLQTVIDSAKVFCDVLDSELNKQAEASNGIRTNR